MVRLVIWDAIVPIMTSLLLSDYQAEPNEDDTNPFHMHSWKYCLGQEMNSNILSCLNNVELIGICVNFKYRFLFTGYVVYQNFLVYIKLILVHNYTINEKSLLTWTIAWRLNIYSKMWQSYIATTTYFNARMVRCDTRRFTSWGSTIVPRLGGIITFIVSALTTIVVYVAKLVGSKLYSKSFGL